MAIVVKFFVCSSFFCFECLCQEFNIKTSFLVYVYLFLPAVYYIRLLLLPFFKSLIKYYGSFFCCFLTLFCWNRITRFSFYYFSVLVGSLVCIEKNKCCQEKYQFRSFVRSILYCLVMVVASGFFCFSLVFEEKNVGK